MDKAKTTMKKGLEKVTKTDRERKLLSPFSFSQVKKLTSPLALQDPQNKSSALNTTSPTKEQHKSMTGGPDPHLAEATHSGNPAGLTGKESMGQPTNKPRR